MLDILSGGLLGSIFGGVFRLAPEVLKFFDKKNERQHELLMFTRQCELETLRGQQKLAEIGAQREAAIDVGVMDLKHFDGSLRPIDRVPQEIKSLYATAFEVETTWIVEAAARRQKWIDQAQSLNIYMSGASGKKLDDTYKLAWLRGLKTTYYLRTISATHAEKSTVSNNQMNAVSSGAASGGATSNASGASQFSAVPATDVKFTAIDDVGCEACQ